MPSFPVLCLFGRRPVSHSATHRFQLKKKLQVVVKRIKVILELHRNYILNEWSRAPCGGAGEVRTALALARSGRWRSKRTIPSVQTDMETSKRDKVGKVMIQWQSKEPLHPHPCKKKAIRKPNIQLRAFQHGWHEVFAAAAPLVRLDGGRSNYLPSTCVPAHAQSHRQYSTDS